MKTLTEFSGTLVRMAAKAVAEARKQLPKDAFRMRVPPPSPEPHPDVEPHDNKNEAPPEEGLDSATDAADDELAKDAVSHIPASALPKPHEFRPGEAETPSDRDTHEDPDIAFRKEEEVAGQGSGGPGPGRAARPGSRGGASVRRRAPTPRKRRPRKRRSSSTRRSRRRPAPPASGSTGCARR